MKLRKKQLVCLIVAAGMLAASGLLTGVSRHLARLPSDQFAAERWEGTRDLSYSQFSAFFGEDAAMLPEEIESLRERMDASLVAASLAPAQEDARIWYDAYSTQVGTLTAEGTRPAGTAAMAVAVGGDFFLLHDWRFLDGSAITEDDLMTDRVVLDETLSWALFGSSDAAGMTVIVNGKRCVVAGVVEPPSDYASAQAYGGEPRLYMPFRLYEDWQAETGQRAAVQCYEAVLPDPVRNFAAGLMDAVVKRPGVQIRNNTSRSSFGETWKQLTHLHEAVTVPEPIAYPHWENAARIIDFDRALLLPVQLLLLAYPALYLLWLLWKGYQLVNGFIRKKTEAYRQRYRSLIRTEEDET
ncbi:MAG: ABC transporter permease [Oscillospiraceae bacterium]|nr:ABC transporter permease [Oscillospiraceae bacterium]